MSWSESAVTYTHHEQWVGGHSTLYAPYCYHGYLYHHTALDEVIKGYCATPSPVKLPDQQTIELIRKTIAKASESFSTEREPSIYTIHTPYMCVHSCIHVCTYMHVQVNQLDGIPCLSSVLSMEPELSLS